MKKLLLLGTLSVLAFAADYSTMSLSELSALKGTVPVEERATFKSAVQTKVQTATVEEKAAFRSTNTGVNQRVNTNTGIKQKRNGK